MSRRALIVNDVRVAREVLKAQLRGLGYEEALVASDGAEALEILQRVRPDIVVSDVHMPILDGFQLCRLMRSDEYPALNGIPVVLTSATFRDHAAQRLAGEVGAQAFLQWPFSLEELRRSIGRVTEDARLRAGGRERILVVEDEVAIRDGLLRVLDQAGFLARGVGDGQEAIDVFDDFRPHIVLCDYMMPRLDGLGFLRFTRAHAPDVPVIMMTAHGSEVLAVTLMKEGAHDYISKPFEVRSVASLCRSALERFSVKSISRQFGEMLDALSRSEGRYRALFERAGEALFLCDRDGTVRELNERGAQLLGTSPESLVGRPLRELFAPVDARLGVDPMTALRRGVVTSLEVVRARPGERPVPIELALGALAVDGDEHVLAIARDLDDRKWIGAFVRHEHQFLSQLHRTTRLIDSESGFGEFLAGTLRGAMALLGMDAGAVAVPRWGDAVFDPERATLSFAGELDAGAIRGLVPSAFQTLAGQAAADDEPVRIELLSDPGPSLRAAGYEMGVAALLASRHGRHGVLLMWRRHRDEVLDRDLTLLRSIATHLGLTLENAALFARVALAHDDWQRTFDAALDSILVADADGRIARVNAEACRRIGASAGELVGQGALAVLFGDEPEVGSELLRAPQDAGPRRIEGSVPGLGGGVFALTSAPLRAQDGSSRGVAIVARDVTSERRAQQQLIVAEKMSTIGRMAAGVTHEINNPAAFVMLNVSHLHERLEGLQRLLGEYRDALAAAGGLDAVERLQRREEELGAKGLVEDLQSVAAESIEGMQRIRDITQDLRIFSRIGDSEPKPFELNGVIDAAIGIARHQVKHRARLVVEHGALPACVGDSQRMTQVFVNLLVNAAQSIPEGHADENTVTARTGWEGRRMFGEVSDTGVGIRRENLARIFEPFFTTKDPGQGTGLGLALSLEIVRRHGGDIEVKSEPGRGSTFRVWLPTVERRADGSTAPASGALEAAPAPSRARILFIEDEASLRRAIKRVLSEHDLVFAESGREALRILEKDTAFELLLCDIVMPDVSGLEVYEWLRSARPELVRRLAFMTGGVRSDEALVALRAAGRPIIEKPIEAAGLRGLIAALRSGAA